MGRAFGVTAADRIRSNRSGGLYIVRARVAGTGAGQDALDRRANQARSVDLSYVYGWVLRCGLLHRGRSVPYPGRNFRRRGRAGGHLRRLLCTALDCIEFESTGYRSGVGGGRVGGRRGAANRVAVLAVAEDFGETIVACGSDSLRRKRTAQRDPGRPANIVAHLQKESP